MKRFPQFQGKDMKHHSEQGFLRCMIIALAGLMTPSLERQYENKDVASSTEPPSSTRVCGRKFAKFINRVAQRTE
jgi:hypothetical protein